MDVRNIEERAVKRTKVHTFRACLDREGSADCPMHQQTENGGYFIQQTVVPGKHAEKSKYELVGGVRYEHRTAPQGSLVPSGVTPGCESWTGWIHVHGIGY